MDTPTVVNGTGSSTITCCPGARTSRSPHPVPAAQQQRRAHVEQKNWAVARTVAGYHRYDTNAELALLNRIWVLQSLITNYYLPPAEAGQ
jgi:hypothetical protein